MPFSTSNSVEYFASATLFAGLLPTLLGINAILRPASALSLFDFPTPSQPEGQRLARSLMQIYGSRNVAVGLTTLAIWSSGDRHLLGLVMFALTQIAIVDGFVSRAQIGRGQWNHWVFAILGAGLGAGVLGLF